MSPSAARDGDASRPRSGILTPSSGASLNRRRDGRSVSPEGWKPRRADAAAMDHLLKPLIAVKPHPPKLHVQPRILQPLMLVPREHLPLAFFDFAAADGEWPQSRFYESHVKILDLERRVGSSPSLLLARHDAKGIVYALERQENGLYVLCRLGPWVDLEALATKATALSHERLRPARQARNELETVTAITTPRIHKEQKKKRAAIEAIQSLVRKRPKPQSASQPDHAVQPQSQLPTPDTTKSEEQQLAALSSTPSRDPLEDVAPPTTQQTADSIVENIRTQYFEALYRSMGSLAYFAKGPLSRARSAFHLDLESNLDMTDLVDFLKSLVLTTVQIDKKYRDTIPGVIAKMTSHVDTSDEGARRKRKPKKMRLGKDGLYPLEDATICDWWTANKPALDNDQAGLSTSQVKSRISRLRTRETQLQMIIILEILALEPLTSAGDTCESSLPPLPGALSPEQAHQMAPPPKKRSKHNLPVLVDVHADRLTIWQSTASDEQLSLEDSQAAQPPFDGQVTQKASSEPLKDFCVDVIVPFFSARLPELCSSINRKLGGPVIASPLNSRATKRGSGARDQQPKPGSVTKRPTPSNSNPRRTLQRALSTDQQHRRSVSRGPSNVIALMRSATSTSVPAVKREGSEPASIKSLPKGEASSSRQRQPTLFRTSTMTSLQDAKASKQALVEAELKDAISALRKPNRGVVGKAMAEADERRAVAGLFVKKARKQPRASSSSVVKATPANNRFRDVLAEKHEPDEEAMSHDGMEEMIPPSSVCNLVPSTSSRTGHWNAFLGSTPPALELVGGTPIRPSTQPSFIRRPPVAEPAMSPSSPLMDRRMVGGDSLSIPGSAEKPRARQSAARWQQQEHILATPVKRPASRPEPMDGPANGPSQHTGSIYQQLGWDDDFDDL
ncbi:hypothetical protein RJ55_01487 [Drechmeria coniospora]|nr:hypothetical protein RJ55_01487 [Drechmeria coniospora]